MINVQLPPKSATLSAMTCPKVRLSTSSSTLETKDLSSVNDLMTFLSVQRMSVVNKALEVPYKNLKLKDMKLGQ